LNWVTNKSVRRKSNSITVKRKQAPCHCPNVAPRRHHADRQFWISGFAESESLRYVEKTNVEGQTNVQNLRTKFGLIIGLRDLLWSAKSCRPFLTCPVCECCLQKPTTYAALPGTPW
jgi:hypothetical protein